MLAQEPALRSVYQFTAPPVTVRLAEPIFSGHGNSIRLLVRAAQLQTLLERENASETPRRLEDVCQARPRVAELLNGLIDDAAALYPGSGSPMPLLEETGLSAMCPLVAHYLGDPDKVYRSDDVPNVREYLEHVGALNQLLCIANQLRDDVLSMRHKYTAHKIALLYHAINNSKLARDVLRKRIEEHFEDVKEATETQEKPDLPQELADWIVGLCDQVASLVREPPASFGQKAKPVVRYLDMMAQTTSR